MVRRHPALLALALSPLAACAAAKPALPAFDPVPVHAEFPVVYEARVASFSPEDTPSVLVGDQLPAAAPEAGAQPQIEIGCELLRMDAATAEHLFGLSPAAGMARSLDLARVRSILESELVAEEAAQITAPHLIVNAGRLNTITVCNQTAYIRHFDLEVGGGMAVADPVVDVATDGVFLHVLATGRPEDLAVALDLELVVSSLRRPIPVVETTIPGSDSPVQFQQPVLCSQRLTTSAALTPDECLLLAAFDGESADEHLLAFLTARHLGRVVVAADAPAGASGSR